MGIGSHSQPVRGKSDEWLTPPEIISALGPFDLDPCATWEQAINGHPWPTADGMYAYDGLDRPWHGFVWLNPPYGQQTWKWLDRLSRHENGGIALVFARTETEGFWEQVWNKATALLFIKGRLYFYHPDGTRAAGNSGAPSVLVGYGALASNRMYWSGIEGAFVDLSLSQ